MDEQQPPPEPPPEDGETWDQMAARVQAEEINGAYAKALMTSFQAYLLAGFTYPQAWELTLSEHQSRLDYMGQAAMFRPPDEA